MLSANHNTRTTVEQAATRAFPVKGTALYDLITNSNFKSSFHARLKSFNPFMVALYRLGVLPLFGLGKRMMLITTRGRKSGQLRHFPVGYARIDNVIHVFSGWGRGANWYKNLLAHPEEVSVQVGFRRFPARAKVLDDPRDIQRTLERFVRQAPSQARDLMGWDPERDRIATADFSPMIERVLTIQFFER
jgi:deazaflavin-dependent oxidoreductase (nitroreductase family)